MAGDGNEATALGAIRGGIRFAAAYPITLATEVQLRMACAQSRQSAGGFLMQAEDELAAINMIIGASYGGTPSITATSGPGLSLMIEVLLTASETPLAVVDVMMWPFHRHRHETEQGGFEHRAVWLHGDAPHIVVAPQSVGDCLFTTQWATHLAEAMQTPAIVLSDQFVGQTRAAIERPADVSFIGQRLTATEIAEPYKRYALTANGISPMAIPGTRGGQYTAEGLTHSERGLPTTSETDHNAQLDKRRDKLNNFAYGDHWATLEGTGDLAVITWGSLTGIAREAIHRAAQDGVNASLIAPRSIFPIQNEQMMAALAGKTRVLVIEQTHSGQFYHYLKAHYDMPGGMRVFNRAGPIPITIDEIHRAIMEWR